MCLGYTSSTPSSLTDFLTHSAGGRRISAGGTAAGAATQLFRSPSFSSGRSSGVALDADDIHSDVSMEDDVHDLMNQVTGLLPPLTFVAFCPFLRFGTSVIFFFLL